MVEEKEKVTQDQEEEEMEEGDEKKKEWEFYPNKGFVAINEKLYKPKV